MNHLLRHTVLFCIMSIVASPALAARDTGVTAVRPAQGGAANTGPDRAPARPVVEPAKAQRLSLRVAEPGTGKWVDETFVLSPIVLDLRWSIEGDNAFGMDQSVARESGAIMQRPAMGGVPADAVAAPKVGTVKWRLVDKPWLAALGTPMPAALGEGTVDTSQPQFMLGLAKYLPKTPPASPKVLEYWIHIWPEAAAHGQIAESKGTVHIIYAATLPSEQQTRQDTSLPDRPYWCEGNALIGRDGSRYDCHLYMCRDEKCLTTCENINDCWDPDGKTSYCTTKKRCDPR